MAGWIVRGGGKLIQFRISDTFIDSLAKLTGEEQKAVKTTAFDLQLNPVSPGLSFHKLDKASKRRSGKSVALPDIFPRLPPEEEVGIDQDHLSALPFPLVHQLQL